MSLLVRARVLHQLWICHLHDRKGRLGQKLMPHPRRVQSLRGHAANPGDRCRGLPTALPASMKAGLRRYERGYTNGVTSISGQVVLYLPDKEFRYLRTVIVTAAVYWGLDSKLRLAANLSS